ncbi:MAG: L,D-transpeptidase [Pseudomonadota bacterium]
MERSISVHVDIASQRLRWSDGHGHAQSFLVSTAASGIGQQMGSEQTPLGRHVVRARIGDGAPLRAVFVGRRETGEIWSPQLDVQFPARDWILTRILWLSGTEPGLNRLGRVDSMRRYIYIHGTPDDQPMGRPASHGCVRMRNDDVLWLFDHVPVGTPVTIAASAATG